MHRRAIWQSWWPDGLPYLRGRRWGAFLFVWFAALGALLVGATLSIPPIVAQARGKLPSNELLGFLLDRDRPWPTVSLPIGSEAIAAGLHRGDRIVAVAGRSPAPFGEAFDRQLAGPQGSVLKLQIESANGMRRDVSLTRDPAHESRALAAAGLPPRLPGLVYNVLALSGAILLPLTCSILLLIRRARDRLSPWASLMMLLFSLGNGMAGFHLATLFANPYAVYNMFNFIGFSALLVVLAVFPEGRFKPRWSLFIAVAMVLLNWWTQSWPTQIGNIVLVLMQAAAIAAIATRYRTMPPGTGRQQIRWALLGFAGSLVGLAVLIGFQFARQMTGSFGVYSWVHIGSAVAMLATNGLVITGITFGLLRYRLYDADAAISRSFVYGALTLSLLAIFAGSEKVIEMLGEHYFGEELGALAGGLGAAVAAVMIAPIHHFVSHWAERRFRSGLARLRHGLPLLVGDMRETASPLTLADAMLARVETGVRAKHGAVLLLGELLDTRDIEPSTVRRWLGDTSLPDDATGLHADRSDPLFPMRVALRADGVGHVGWLLLGPRPDGSFYGREDRAALEEIADPIARALAIAHARQRREEEANQQVERLRQMVLKLYSFVGLEPEPNHIPS